MRKFILLWSPLAILVSLAIGGCAQLSTLANFGADAMDEGLISAEFVICKAASVGSVQRRYGQSAEMSAAWRGLCLTDGANTPVPFIEME